MARRTPPSLVKIDPLVPPTRVCKTLKISLATFRRWEDKGLLPTVKVGRATRMRSTDLARITNTGLLLKGPRS